MFPSFFGFKASRRTRVRNELCANRPIRARSAATVAVLLAIVMGILAAGFTAVVTERWGRVKGKGKEIENGSIAAFDSWQG